MFLGGRSMLRPYRNLFSELAYHVLCNHYHSTSGRWKIMVQFAVIDAPSILGLKPTGVEHLPEALKKAGLMSELRAEYGGRVSPRSYSSERDKLTLLLN